MDNTFILDIFKRKGSLKRRIALKLFGVFNKYFKFFSIRLKELYSGDMVNIEETININHLLNHVVWSDIPGDVVELGCHEGYTSITIQKTLDQSNSNKRLHVYDSFEGVPLPDKVDGTFLKRGDCDTTRDRLVNNFRMFGVRLPEIHAGWFKDTLPTQLPEKICFAHLDGDLYSSITESLENVYPRLSRGAIVVVDDYTDPEVHSIHNILPGVKKACDDFFRDKKEKVNVLIAGERSHGYFRKE